MAVVGTLSCGGCLLLLLLLALSVARLTALPRRGKECITNNVFSSFQLPCLGIESFTFIGCHLKVNLQLSFTFESLFICIYVQRNKFRRAHRKASKSIFSPDFALNSRVIKMRHGFINIVIVSCVTLQFMR